MEEEGGQVIDGITLDQRREKTTLMAAADEGDVPAYALPQRTRKRRRKRGTDGAEEKAAAGATNGGAIGDALWLEKPEYKFECKNV